MTDLSHRLVIQIRPLADDLRRLFEELDRERGSSRPASGEYEPAVDVLETDESVEVVVNLPGVSAQEMRVVVRAGVVLIAGDKRPAATAPGAAFHLAERRYGRFVRVVHLSSACDGPHATARMRQGELRITVPKHRERRDDPVAIQIQVD